MKSIEVKLISGCKKKAIIQAPNNDAALSYYKGRFGTHGKVIKTCRNKYTVRCKNCNQTL